MKARIYEKIPSKSCSEFKSLKSQSKQSSNSQSVIGQSVKITGLSDPNQVTYRVDLLKCPKPDSWGTSKGQYDNLRGKVSDYAQ